MKESYTLRVHLLLKQGASEEDISFEDVFKINFENPTNEDKAKLANDTDFQKNFSLKYPSMHAI